LLDDLGASFGGIVTRNRCAQSEQVHKVSCAAFASRLVSTTQNELELGDVDVDGLQCCRHAMLVVFCSEHDQVDGRLEIVEKAVHIGQQHLDLASRRQELSNLEHGHEVSAMRLPRRGSSPVDAERSLSLAQHIFDDFGVQDFLQIALDELEVLGGLAGEWLWCRRCGHDVLGGGGRGRLVWSGLVWSCLVWCRADSLRVHVRTCKEVAVVGREETGRPAGCCIGRIRCHSIQIVPIADRSHTSSRRVPTS